MTTKVTLDMYQIYRNIAANVMEATATKPLPLDMLLSIAASTGFTSALEIAVVNPELASELLARMRQEGLPQSEHLTKLFEIIRQIMADNDQPHNECPS